MTNRTDYLNDSNLVDARITAVLQGWIEKESNNLEAFMDNPSEHVNYNPYMIFDFSKLNDRLTMLRVVEGYLSTITLYKQGDSNTTESMYQNALDSVPSIIWKRLLDWLNQRYTEMTNLIADNGDPNNISPLHDYIGMFTFDQNKFMEEYTMYGNSLTGVNTIVNYKVEQGV